MKKITALILMLTVAFSLFACENVEYGENTSSKESVDSYESLISQLPDYSFPEYDESSENGIWEISEFSVATENKGVFCGDEKKSGTISAVVEERNNIIREKYNVVVNEKIVSASEIAAEISSAKQAGLQYADLLCFPTSTTVTLMTSGLLGDFNSLPGFDIDAKCFDNVNAKTLATNSSLYLLPDEISLVYDETYVIFYNRDLLEGKTDVSPETLAAKGEWTWDKFIEYAKLGSNVYNKTAADLDTDIFGYGAYYLDDTYALSMWASTGNRVVDNTYKNPVALSMTAEGINSVTSKLHGYLDTKGKYSQTGNEASNAFKEGRMVFICNKLQYFYGLRNGVSGNQYGILPMPKLTEEQDRYYCLADTDAGVLSIPITLESAEEAHKNLCGVVITALCTVSSENTRNAYLSMFISLYLNDNSETLMLQTVTESVFFDFSYVYGSSIKDIKRCAIAVVADNINFGSNVASTISLRKAAFDKYCTDNFK